MTLAQLIAQLRAQIATKLGQRNQYAKDLEALRSVTDVDEAKVAEIRSAKDAIDSEVDQLNARAADLELELAKDDAASRLAREVTPGAESRAYDQVARVGQEKRTYNPDVDRDGKQFLLDVARQFRMNDPEAAARIARHMVEERVERAEFLQRAAGTGAFSGLVVPQYLTDLYAPAAKAGRPFADACRSHPLPPEGMTVSIGKVTTATSVDLQSAENAAVSETDIDDTLLTINVQTAGGQQTLSRQAIERGVGVDGTTVDDLFRGFGTALDGKLLNQAVNGLTNVATAITYTDATPTAPELYPKLLAAPAAVEAALLDQAIGDTFAVMHSRRWYWLQSQLTSTWPMFGQVGLAAQQGGLINATTYGSGFRGVLPSGVPVVVDNNIATNLGAGTNEDEIYFAAKTESHLWEDPQAPMLIRAEQTKAASLGVLLVVYGYFAYTFARRTHAQKVSGTGLVTPTF